MVTERVQASQAVQTNENTLRVIQTQLNQFRNEVSQGQSPVEGFQNRQLQELGVGGRIDIVG